MPLGVAPMKVPTTFSGGSCGWPACFHCSIVGGLQMSIRSVARTVAPESSAQSPWSPAGPTLQVTSQQCVLVLRLKRSNCGALYLRAMVEQVSFAATRCVVCTPYTHEPQGLSYGHTPHGGGGPGGGGTHPVREPGFATVWTVTTAPANAERTPATKSPDTTGVQRHEQARRSTLFGFEEGASDSSQLSSRGSVTAPEMVDTAGSLVGGTRGMSAVPASWAPRE